MCVDLGYKRFPSPPVDSRFSDQSLTDDSSGTTSSASPPYSVSKPEAMWYYSGLPSNPLLVYRTGTTPWKQPTGPEAYRVLKEVKPVFGHEIVTV
jgi:hypothetical protein